MNAIVGEWTPDSVRMRLTAAAGAAAGDADLNPGMPGPTPLRPAAVLIAFMQRADGVHILLTRRSDALKAHAGQIAFPGGRIDADDASPEAAALREAEEEVGLPPARVTILGRLHDYETRTGFRVAPIVAWATPPERYAPCPVETAEVFEAPAATLLDPQRRIIEHYEVAGARRRFYTIPVGERRVWGATAGMLVQLSDALGY
ncbi:MAG: CoA pyrophosphatase [Pseudomonadota bacterium]